jgi:hypothetical protein
VRGALAARLLCACLAGTTFTVDAHADVPISEQAARRFEEGVRYLRSHDPDRYEKAYREFKAAYDDSPSWKILGNLGIVAQELERDGEAIEAYKGYLEGGRKELSLDEKKQFKRDLALLESGLTTLTLRTLPDGAWIVDERLPEAGTPIVNRYGPTSGPLELRVRAGHHRLRAELRGYEDATWEFSEGAGALVAHTFELKQHEAPVAAPSPPPPPMIDAPAAAQKDGSSLPTWGFVSLGVGAVGLGAGTYFLIDASKKRNDGDTKYEACLEETQMDYCPPDTPLSNAVNAASEAEGRALTRSLIGFSVGGAFVATGVVLLLVGSSDGGATEQASITPWFTPNGVGVTGSF